MKSHLENNYSNQSQTWINDKGLQKEQRYIKNTVPPQEKISHPRPKVNSVSFDDPYDHIHHMEHYHENTHLIDAQE